MLSDLEKLKELLFGHEKKALDAITRRLETPASRTADVADILPDALERSYDHDPRLKVVLQQPLEDSLNEAIRRDPQKFADGLFPVIGPAIRKAIAEALKGLVQSINRAVDTSLSPTARFKAWRAGVPLGEWVLSQSVVYRVDEIYLIDPDNGLLVEHVSHREVVHKDEDAVSAMLTAIQDFVRDSFAEGGGGGLNSAAVGDRTVWISQGPHAMLAAVIRGTPPAGLRTTLDRTLERIHLVHAPALREFDGSAIAGIDSQLEECLQTELRESAKTRRTGLPLSVRLILLALAAALVFWLVSGYLKDRKLVAWGDAMRGEPGVVLTYLERRGRTFHAQGLKDPLAADPAILATAAGIEDGRVDMDFRPFQSLDGDIVARRVGQILEPPGTVTLRVNDGTLTVSGVAAQAWRERAETLAPTLGGVTAVDFSGVLPDDSELLARLRATLRPPTGVEMEVIQGRVSFGGTAPSRWIDELPARLAGFAGLRGTDLSGLGRAELLELRASAARIDGQSLYFGGGGVLQTGQAASLSELASRIRLFGRRAAALGLTPEIIITGYTDGTGLPIQNQSLRILRAETVKQYLISDGVDAAWLFVQGGGEASFGEGSNPNMRRATIRIKTTDPDGRSLTN